MIRRPCRRLYSSIVEDRDFERRKALVKSCHLKHYPTLSQVSFVSDGGPLRQLRIPQFRKMFGSYEFPDSKRIDEKYKLNGRILSIRKSGKGMIFIDLLQDFEKLQIVASNKMMNLSKEEFATVHEVFKIGDSISCVGYPGITNVGELSIKLLEPLQNLAPSLHLLPPQLTDASKINSNRVIDYLVNKRSQDIIVARSKLISTIRDFFNALDFVEVETPIIAGGGTGANAKPFITTSNHVKDNEGSNLPLYLRVAPELWLKKMIISGFDKVYEIGKVFRNEGLDSTHNVEFTTCEFYQTFTSLEELMEITESLFTKIMNSFIIDDKLQITHEQCYKLLSAVKDNDNKFARLEFIPTIESQTKLCLPLELTTEKLSSYFDELNLEHPVTRSPQQYLDKLSSIYIEPLCRGIPTFIYNQPSIMSPLAKSDYKIYSRNRQYLISKRFELFIHGKEYVNSYEEENNPFKQLENFQLQQSAKQDYKDDESLVPDYKFVENMELGMSPTGGWGLGIDRLAMLLTGSDRIENVLSFGKLNDVLRQ